MTSSAQQIQRPGGKVILAAVTAVAAVYVYFLIFAQFGFLKAVQTALGAEVGVIRPVLVVMGLAGVTGSVLAAQFFSEQGGRRRFAAGFGVCDVAAAWALSAKNPTAFYVVAGLTGLGVGLTTVTLAGMLRRAVGHTRLGLIIGAGTGLAYGFCNLPGIFDAGATTQAWIAILAATAGWAGGSQLTPRFQLEELVGAEHARAGVAAWVVIFAALVCLDSAAFQVIQHTPALKETTWTGTGRLALNAGVHLGVAVLAGWVLDRGWLGRTAGLAAAALLLACWLINERPQALAWAGLLYAAGVSAYSTTLVYYPAHRGRPGLAALVYAVAGWGGTALGIGLVAGGQKLPAGLPMVAGFIIVSGLLAGTIARRRAT